MLSHCFSLLLSTMLDCIFYISCAFVLSGFGGGGVVFIFYIEVVRIGAYFLWPLSSL